MMRFLSLTIAALLIGLPPAFAQDKPLYNSGARPLSLKQITKGVSESGYSYSRSNNGRRPYGATGGTGNYPSASDVAAFRKRRAAEAQSSEQNALASLQQVHKPPLSNPASAAGGLPSALPGQGVLTGQPGAAQPKVRQQYKGRDTGVKVPPRIFNTIR